MADTDDVSVGDKVKFKLDPSYMSDTDEDEYCELHFEDGRVWDLSQVTMAAFDNMVGEVIKKLPTFFGPPERHIYYIKVPVQVVVLVYDEEIVREQVAEGSGGSGEHDAGVA